VEIELLVAVSAELFVVEELVVLGTEALVLAWD